MRIDKPRCGLKTSLGNTETATGGWLVAQLGSRMHYAVPRILNNSGQLNHLYTDITGSGILARLATWMPRGAHPNALRRLLARCPKGIPKNKTTGFDGFGIDYYARRAMCRSEAELIEVNIWAGRTFCRRIKGRGFGNSEGIYVFNSAGLELMEFAKEKGLRIVLEQTIAPREIEMDLLNKVNGEFPGWRFSDRRERAQVTRFSEREKAEWALADIILCGSQFVVDGIKASGGPSEKCIVVPYGVDFPDSESRSRPHKGPLRVLTVGAVGLRKGAPYTLMAARALSGIAEFRMVGPIDVTEMAESMLRQHIDIIGVVPRSEIKDHYDWADIFLLPTVCEGSATVTYEALASGLPVVCTPNAGSVVRSGEGGYVVPAFDSSEIIDLLKELNSNRVLLEYQSGLARKLASENTSNSYGIRLTKAIDDSFWPSPTTVGDL